MEERGANIEDENAVARAWRLFVAISLPPAVQHEIEKAQQELRRALPGRVVRWTKREQFHLTLKFLGNVAELRVAELIEALRAACLDFAALRLNAKGVGFFPDRRYPRVIWAGVQDEKGALPRFQQSVEASVNNFVARNGGEPGSAGVPPASSENAAMDGSSPPGRRRSQETFTGHVTLGRIQRINRSEAELLAKATAGMANQSFGEWMADSAELIRSEFSSAGSRYTTVAAIPLSGKA